MPLIDLPLGWQTEFILHRLDAQITEHADCLAVRTASNPTFYWGNCLLLRTAPADTDLAHWRARFDTLITAGRPEARHVAIGITTPREGQTLPAWLADGFELDDTAVLALRHDQPLAPPAPLRAAAQWQLRPIAWATECNRFLDLQCQDCAPFEPAAYRVFRRLQMARIERLAQVDRGQWFGLWCDGTLAADCGLIRDAARPGALGRFQSVTTYPQWRRRGLCTALVRGVNAWGFGHWQLDQAVICADPHDVAVGIYRSLGYRDVGSHWQLQRNALNDRPCAPPSAASTARPNFTAATANRP